MSKFVKGDPRINRKGAPRKEMTMTNILADLVDEMESVKEGDKKKTMTVKEIVMKKALTLALKGDLAAIKFVVERIDGRPNQAILFPAGVPLVDGGKLDPAEEKHLREQFNLLMGSKGIPAKKKSKKKGKKK